MTTKIIKHLCLILLFAMLSSCATLPTKQANQQYTVKPWQTRKLELTSIKSWNIRGSISIRTPKGADQASFTWLQQKGNYVLRIIAPLGISSIKLTGTPNKVTLQTAKNKYITARNAEILLQEQTGWHLPISNLYYWIRGLDVPNVPAQRQFDTYNHLTNLYQQGWNVHYSNYVHTKTADLPSKIVLNTSNILVKIVISH